MTLFHCNCLNGSFTSNKLTTVHCTVSTVSLYNCLNRSFTPNKLNTVQFHCNCLNRSFTPNKLTTVQFHCNCLNRSFTPNKLNTVQFHCNCLNRSFTPNKLNTVGMVQTICLFSGKIQTIPRSWKNRLSCSEWLKVPRKCLAIQKYDGKVEKSIFLWEPPKFDENCMLY